MTPSLRWEQITWLSNELLRNDDTHSAICMHIYRTAPYDNNTVTSFAENVLSIVSAYNNRTEITLNGNSYNFTNCSGKIGFILSGHIHLDEIITNVAVPIIITPNTSLKDNPVGDLVSVDWTNGVINLIRFEDGVKRTTEIVI